ncbi:MAG: DUF354 domain-containing protein [Bacteroidales bacterium]|nr:DUF354 domain-containing protein [Bacteroidales bacterium]
MKRIIFDIGHPAQVHNFKHLYRVLVNKGWKGLFTTKDKDVTIALLEKYNLPYIVIGKSGQGIINKVLGLLRDLSNFIKILGQFKPDIIVCRFSIHSVWGAKIKGIPVIGLADTEHTKLVDWITIPFSSAKLTSTSYWKNLGTNHFRFRGNIELFYLHPNRYTPPPAAIPELSLKQGQKYVLIRFVSWGAHHDIGQKGFTLATKIKIVELLAPDFKIFISSEGELPVGISQYQVKFSPDKIHDVLAHAALYIGEGASMASEAAVLGIPSVYVNTLDVGYVLDEAKAGLVFNFRDEKGVIVQIKELMQQNDLQKSFREKRAEFLKDKIDVTAFLTWFIEDYPHSKRILLESPDFSQTFI